MSNTKKRLDEQMLINGYVETRTRAQNLILASKVKVNNITVRQKSFLVSEPDIITVDDSSGYVSRGGNKLEHAIKEFNVDIKEKICLDIGSSTGGFTDCLLRHGAKKVYAIDVGHNQLAYKLRKDERVISIEKTNIKNITRDIFDEIPSIIVSDVSFISITKFADIIKTMLYDMESWISLIKPQFESEKGSVGKGGIIRDDNLRESIFNKCKEDIKNHGFEVVNSCLSPIKGAKGNIEYFTLFTLPPSNLL